MLNNRAQGTTSDAVSQVGDRALSGTIAGGGFCWAGHAVPVYYYAEFSRPFAAKPALSNDHPVTLTFNVRSEERRVATTILARCPAGTCGPRSVSTRSCRA
nr:hypothetical protein [Burkholderia sola]